MYYSLTWYSFDFRQEMNTKNEIDLWQGLKICVRVQERLSVLAVPCLRAKHFPHGKAVIRRRRLSQWGIETRH